MRPPRNPREGQDDFWLNLGLVFEHNSCTAANSPGGLGLENGEVLTSICVGSLPIDREGCARIR
jgi:hypothetical protein